MSRGGQARLGMDRPASGPREPEVLIIAALTPPTLETIQGQMDGFFPQLPFRCYLPQGD